MQTITSAHISVGQSFDSAAAQQTSREIAVKLGFAPAAAEEIALAVTELASNFISHAHSGMLTLRLLDTGDRMGIEVEADDQGPGMRNQERLFPGSDPIGNGLDYGLDSVKRLMDEIEIGSTAALGTRILCRRWLNPKVDPAMKKDHPWQVGVATRPCHLAAANGDAFVIRECAGHLLAGVIDGLGHGEAAQQAALAAQAYVQSHPEMPLDQLFRGVNSACRGTRGVVMALARFASPTEMTLANLGNIEMRTWTSSERFEIVVQRGFLGAQEDQVRVQKHRWDPKWMFVLHSDGLRAQWQWSDFPGLQHGPPQAAANELLKTLAKDDDDATVLTVKSWGAEPGHRDMSKS
jgi:anti-sigma regulatory factor (Ser/Thr protein kinase)/serine/threonine protein phosphatase PrpC